MPKRSTEWNKSRIIDSYENANCEFKDFTNGKSNIFDSSGTMTRADMIKNELACEICAFANSDGGNIIIGVDDKTKLITGFPKSFKRRGTMVDSLEWFNDVLADLLVPRLNSFNIAVVQPHPVNSQIPTDKSVFVIEISPSQVAPHQTANSKDFYQRIGSSAKKAEHRYLSLLWSRSTFPGETVARVWLYAVVTPMIRQLDSVENFYKSFCFRFDQMALGLDDSSLMIPFLRVVGSPNMSQFLEHHGEHSEELLSLRKKMDGVISCYEELTLAISKTILLNKALPNNFNTNLLNRLGTESFLIKRLDTEHRELLQKIRLFETDDTRVALSAEEIKILSEIVFDTHEAKKIKRILSAYTAFCLAAHAFKECKTIEHFQTSTKDKSREYWSVVLRDYLDDFKSEHSVSSKLKTLRSLMSRNTRLAKNIKTSWEGKRKELEQRYGIPREDTYFDPADIMATLRTRR